MEDYKEQIVVGLAKPIKFKPKNSGELQDCNALILKAPSNKVMTQIAKLEQGYSRATSEMQEKLLASDLFKDPEVMEGLERVRAAGKTSVGDEPDDEVEETEDEKAKKVVEIIKGSNKLEFTEYLMTFRELILKVGFLDDDTNMTVPLFEELSTRDTTNLLGKYLVNFTSISSQEA